MVRRQKTLARAPHGDDKGASLILALIFMVVVSMIVLAMAAWASTGLRSSIAFTYSQSSVATANSVADLALHESRSSFLAATLNASPGVPCWANGATPSVLSQNSQSMSAWCSTAWNPQSDTATRRVTIDICPLGVSAATCAVTPFLLVIATFDDFPTTGGPAACSPLLTGVTDTSCGTKMSIRSWVYGANPPSINAPVTVSTTLACGTKLAQITGTNFIVGATNVYFVTPTVTVTSPPQTIWSSLYLASSVNVTSSTSLTACEPAVATGATSVMVSTQIGQSLLAPLP